MTRRANNFEFEGAVCVVTGASSGLGRRFALDLAAAGATVIGVARRADRLESLERKLEQVGRSHSSTTRTCDVSDIDSYLRLLVKTEDDAGRIDLLVNCAGIGEPSEPGSGGPSTGASTGTRERETKSATEAYRAVMGTNYLAAVAGTLFVLPGMLERRHGAIVNVSSDSARAPSPGEPAYCASKSALSAFTECQALATDGTGVHVHVLYPGWVPTEMGNEAIDRGMPMPPSYVRRTEVGVSRLMMRRIGAGRIDIDAARVARMAPVVRSLAPGAYKRGVLKSTGYAVK